MNTSEIIERLEKLTRYDGIDALIADLKAEQTDAPHGPPSTSVMRAACNGTGDTEIRDDPEQARFLDIVRQRSPVVQSRRVLEVVRDGRDATEALVEAEKELSELKGLFAGRNPEKCTVSDNARLAALKEEADGEDH